MVVYFLNLLMLLALITKKSLKIKKDSSKQLPIHLSCTSRYHLMKTMENHKFYQVINRQYGPKNSNSSLNSDWHSVFQP